VPRVIPVRVDPISSWCGLTGRVDRKLTRRAVTRRSSPGLFNHDGANYSNREARCPRAIGGYRYNSNREGAKIVRRERVTTLLLVLLAALPIVAVAFWSIRQTVIGLADPCATWVQAPADGAAISAVITPQDPCKVKTVHAQSKARALIVAAVVPGGLLASTLLAVAGAALSRRRLILAGAAGTLTETLVVFTLAPLTLAVGLTYLVLSRRVHPAN